MILKYKYHSDSGLLEAYRSYTLAQNNSLADTIVITSTAKDADRYNYCLEFMCYNSKSIPKAQYISPILKYIDGAITFAIPNNLTEFRGHVDIQLTGYDPDDNSIVFKSISKNCKAFDVEGSLCVLEQDLNDTPNVFTEVLKQLEQLKQIHQDIIDEAMEKFGSQIFERVANYKWRKVKFFDNGKLLDEQWVVDGSKLTPPQYTLPQYCVIAGGWYNPVTETIWDMDKDTVQGDIELYLNYMTQDLVIQNGVVMSLGSRSNAHIYIPEYYDGYKVKEVYAAITTVPYKSRIHFGNNMQEFESLLSNTNVSGLYYPSNNPEITSKDGSLYTSEDGLSILAYAPKTALNGIYAVDDGCVAINTMAIVNATEIRKIILPESLQYILDMGICGTGIEELIIPRNVTVLGEHALFNNFSLKWVYLEGDCSATLNDESFYNLDLTGKVTRPKLRVLPQYYQNYKALNLAYEIEVVGKDYFDSVYAPKGV